MLEVMRLLLPCVGLLACSQIPPPAGDPPPDGETPSEKLRVSEVVANNEGAWIDEWGEVDDFIEIENTSSRMQRLSRFQIVDGTDQRVTLPDVRLDPGEVVVLWADDEPEQGELHLPFKLSSGGERVRIIGPDEELVDDVSIPELDINEAYARFGNDFAVCRYPSPTRRNPATCEPPAPPSLVDEEFEPFELPDPYPATTSEVVLSELALRPAEFIEIYNGSDEAIQLSDYGLWLSPHKPGQSWPTQGAGIEVELPDETLRSGERLAVTVRAADTSELEDDPLFEGVATLFLTETGQASNRVDFMRWPEDAALSRSPDENGVFAYCRNTTPDEANECDPLPSREVGDRVRHLRTPGDFAALTEGDPLVGIQSLKWVLDMSAGGVVHLLASSRWPLHYNFVREEIYHEPMLDRCDPLENAEFYQGWYDFSVLEYFRVEGRRFLLGTFSLHGGSGLHAVEYANGDVISPEQMKLGFYSAIPHTADPSEWVLRAQDDEQLEKIREIEGTLPLAGVNAPFVGVEYQPLTRGASFGTLRFIPAGELETATFGRDTIVVTDDVPNDIPFVAGLITEAFQTPLAHVNVLSQNRNTPNAALRDARNDPRLRDHFDTLVRLEVTATELLVREATATEVREFWEERAVAGPALAPRLDTSVRGVQPLELHSLDSIPQIGAKASQMAEMLRINVEHSGCTDSVPIRTPEKPFAVPVVHYIEHFEASGAKDLLAELREDEDFDADPALRAEGLAAVKATIMAHPVDEELLAEVTAAVDERFGNTRVRFRSSSNTEDLPSFNGAGLYTSISAELDQPDRRVDDALRTVWASLWNGRAYDERRYANIDDTDIAMGVLVHPASLSEEANGVAVSRNILDPNRGDIYYINVQAGEASVTNPAPGVTTDQFIYRWPPRQPATDYTSESSVLEAIPDHGAHVLSDDEIRAVACGLGAIHDHFRPKLDPGFENRWFAMEIEFKFLDGDRELLIKQARPHSFGAETFSADCRDL